MVSIRRITFTGMELLKIGISCKGPQIIKPYEYIIYLYIVYINVEPFSVVFQAIIVIVFHPITIKTNYPHLYVAGSRWTICSF